MVIDLCTMKPDKMNTYITVKSDLGGACQVVCQVICQALGILNQGCSLLRFKVRASMQIIFFCALYNLYPTFLLHTFSPHPKPTSLPPFWQPFVPFQSKCSSVGQSLSLDPVVFCSVSFFLPSSLAGNSFAFQGFLSPRNCSFVLSTGEI